MGWGERERGLFELSKEQIEREQAMRCIVSFELREREEKDEYSFQCWFLG